MRSNNRTPDELATRLTSELALNRSDGASVMARQAVALIGRYVDESTDQPAALERLPAFVGQLASARPSMHAIARVLQEWQSLFDAIPERDRDGVARVSRAVFERIEQATDQTVERAREALTGLATLLTHSASSTVERVFVALDPNLVTIVATESNPGGEGRSLARSLRERGYACRLVTDLEAPAAMADADVLVIGADAILANGDVVNKVGSLALVEAARGRRIPAIVVAESFKNARGEVPLERTPDGGQLLFDVTPSEMVIRIGDDVFGG